MMMMMMMAAVLECFRDYAWRKSKIKRKESFGEKNECKRKTRFEFLWRTCLCNVDFSLCMLFLKGVGALFLKGVIYPLSSCIDTWEEKEWISRFLMPWFLTTFPHCCPKKCEGKCYENKLFHLQPLIFSLNIWWLTKLQWLFNKFSTKVLCYVEL